MNKTKACKKAQADESALRDAACSAFQWPYSPSVDVGDVIADAGCMNARRWREMKDLPQPSCMHRTVVAVFPWGLRVTNGTEESDVVDWFLSNDQVEARRDRTPPQQ
jgi:hypothetical protein